MTGHDEYVEHGCNALVVRLGRRARHRAHARPARPRPARCCTSCARTRCTPPAAGRSWEQPGTFMARALHAIDRAPQPSASGGVPRACWRDVRAGLESIPAAPVTSAASALRKLARLDARHARCRCVGQARATADGARAVQWLLRPPRAGHRAAAAGAVSRCMPRLRALGRRDAPLAGRAAPSGAARSTASGVAPLRTGAADALAGATAAERRGRDPAVPPRQRRARDDRRPRARRWRRRGHAVRAVGHDEEGRHGGRRPQVAACSRVLRAGRRAVRRRLRRPRRRATSSSRRAGRRSPRAAARAARGPRVPRAGPRARVLRDVGGARVGGVDLPPGPARDRRRGRGWRRCVRERYGASGRRVRPRRRPRRLPPADDDRRDDLVLFYARAVTPRAGRAARAAGARPSCTAAGPRWRSRCSARPARSVPPFPAPQPRACSAPAQPRRAPTPRRPWASCCR